VRFGGATKEEIISWGYFLNYGITWDSAEQAFKQFRGQGVKYRVEWLRIAAPRYSK